MQQNFSKIESRSSFPQNTTQNASVENAIKNKGLHNYKLVIAAQFQDPLDRVTDVMKHKFLWTDICWFKVKSIE